MNPDANYANLIISLLALTGGLAMLVAGGEGLVAGASKFALRHGMRPMLVGMTIVAFGTSLPELFVSLTAAFSGHVDIMIGNVVGSNIANIGLVLGVAVLLRPLPVRFASIRTELAVVLTASVLVLVIAAVTGYFQRIFGLIFITGLVCYTMNAYRGKNRRNDEVGIVGELLEGGSNLKIIGLQVAGLVLLAYGSDFFIKGAVDIAAYLGLSDLVVGLTVAAVGTSLPELASSLSAVRRRESDILVGNIIGSNMFNLMMVMGGTALVRPFALDGALLWRDLPVMIAFTFVLLPVVYFRKRLDRVTGLVMLAGYIGYIYWVV